MTTQSPYVPGASIGVPGATPAKSSSPNVVGVHYKVGRKIGEGSFGVIYEGVNLLTQQPVAIKFEPRKSDAPQLRDEYRTYKILSGCGKFFIRDSDGAIRNAQRIDSFDCYKTFKTNSASGNTQCLLLWTRRLAQHSSFGFTRPKYGGLVRPVWTQIHCKNGRNGCKTNGNIPPGRLTAEKDYSHSDNSR
jgi:serine/threonine protein kinase